MRKYAAMHYILQISNPVSKHFSAIRTFNFTLLVQDASQTHISEKIKLFVIARNYISISHIPFYKQVWEYSYADARAPPPVNYQEV
jgi:hypothetical protein